MSAHSPHVAFSDPADPGTPIRILIVADGFGPTQQISFLLPLERWRTAGAATVRLIEEAALQRLRVRQGDAAVNNFLESEFHGFKPTVLILSRYCGKDWPKLFSLARRGGTPVVHHLDDDLFEVPIALGIDIYSRYRQPHRVHATYQIASKADLVYVSTPALAERVRRRVNPKRLMVSNIYVGADVATSRLDPRCHDKASGEVRIGYMASASHAFDMELVEAALFAVLNRCGQVTFHLFGSISATSLAKDFGDRAVRYERVTGSYQEFRSILPTLGWDIGLAPLRNNEFNACKAPTKWIEYAEAGIVTAASDHPVYRPIAAAGALAMCADRAWEAGLVALVEDAARRKKIQVAATTLLARDYDWRRIEAQVLDLIAALNQPTVGPESRASH